MSDKIEKLLAAAHIKPVSFEAELGLLCHKWIALTSLDNVIDGMDHETEALEGRRDLELGGSSPPAPLPPSK